LIIGFHPRENSRSQKQCLQQGHCQEQPIKTGLGFSPCKVGLLTSPELSPPLAKAAATSYKSSSKFLDATKTQITVDSPQKFGFHVIPCLIHDGQQKQSFAMLPLRPNSQRTTL
jgi:hypothetical protein